MDSRPYTYLWLREKDGTFSSGVPCYAGKGRGRRAFLKHWNGGRWLYPPKDKNHIIVQYHNTEADALLVEMFHIQMYGRKDNETGCLLNRKDGGEGVPNPSSETRAKMRAAHIGIKPWNKGKKGGTSHMKGKHHTTEALAKMSDAKRGKVSHMKGKHHTAESKDKMSNANMGKTPWNKGLTGFTSPRKGVTTPPEVRAKQKESALHRPVGTSGRMSAGQKRRFSDPQQREKCKEANSKGLCQRYSLNRGRPCTCGRHQPLLTNPA